MSIRTSAILGVTASALVLGGCTLTNIVDKITMVVSTIDRICPVAAEFVRNSGQSIDAIAQRVVTVIADERWAAAQAGCDEIERLALQLVTPAE